MDKTVLEMDFANSLDKVFTLRVDDPKDLSDQEIKGVMNEIINSKVFHKNDLDLTSIKGARKVVTTTKDIVVL